MRRTSRLTLCAVAAAGAALAASASATGASWSAAEKIPNDSSSATSQLGSTNVVANIAPSGRASIVFRARGNRFWVSRRASTTAKFAKPVEAFPKIRPVTNRFDVGMDGSNRLSVALGESTRTKDALTGIAGAIQSSKGFGPATRLNPSNGLTYGDPSVASNPKGDVWAAFSGQSEGSAAVYVMRGSTSNGRYSGRSTLKGLAGSKHVSPPNVDIGVTNSGTVYVAFELEDGSIVSYRRNTSGGWTRLPTIGQPVDGNPVDAFALDVPSSGAAVMAIAQDRDIVVRRLGTGSTEWSAPETVGDDIYAVASDLPVADTAPPNLPAQNLIQGLDVATNSSGAVAVAWGTNPYFYNDTFVGPVQGGTGAQQLYWRSMRPSTGSPWPAPTSSAEPQWEDDPDIPFAITDVKVDMDNRRAAVATWASSGASNGLANPLAASTWNQTGATAWSGTQALSRFCRDSSGGIQGPSLAAYGNRGVVVAWGCSTSTPSANDASGLLWTRSFR